MKELIEPQDIHKGDLIRVECSDESATEWRATGPQALHGGCTYYLIEDRPKPAVVLPTVTTWGWATWDTNKGANKTEYGSWRINEMAPVRFVFCIGGQDFLTVATDRITAFTPATAVPTDALDKLREKHVGDLEPNVSRSVWVSGFFAAVDNAGGTE